METPNVLSGQDKLSVYPPYDAAELSKILDNSTAAKSRLEFHGITFNADTVTLWRTHGSAMNTIEFFDCTFDDANVIAITVHCDKLKRLSWHYEKVTPARGKRPFYSDHALKILFEEKKVMRNSVVALSLSVNDMNWLSVDTLRFLFSIYKNAAEFSIEFEINDIGDNDLRNRAVDRNTTWTTFGILQKLISSTDAIIGVNLRLPSSVHVYRGFVCRLTQPIYEWLRLGGDTNVDENIYKTPDDLIEFCVRRKNLQSVTCALNTEAVEGNFEKEEFANRFLKRILRECPRIRELKLDIDPSYNIVTLDVELFLLLVESGLETLELSCEEMKMSDSLVARATENSLGQRNSTLRSLSLKVNDQETMVMFLKHFARLTHLRAFNAEDDVLQAIWQYQTDLTSLQLLNVVPYTWAFTGRGDESDENYDEKQNTGISIDRLKNLRYLNIEAIEPDWNATDDIFDYFIFPELRHLDLEIMDNSGITTSMVAAIERNMPQLEAIILRYYNEVTYDIWVRLCSQMKQLRYLAMLSDSSTESQYTDNEYQNLFRVRPTLRFLVHNRSTGREVFYYNVVQKKVLKKNSDYVYSDRNKFGLISVKNIQV